MEQSGIDYLLLFPIIAFGVGAVFGIWSRRVAMRKGRNPFLWFLAGFLTFFIAVIAVYLIPTAHPDLKDIPQESKKSMTVELVRCPKCGGSMMKGAFACSICGTPRVREASQASISKDASGKVTVGSKKVPLPPVEELDVTAERWIE